MGPGPDDIVDHMAEIPQFRTPFSHLPEPDGIERRQLGQQKRRHLLETEQQGQRPLLHRLGCGRRIVEILQHMGVAVYLFQPHRELLIEKEAGHQCLFLAQPAGVRRDLFPHRQQDPVPMPPDRDRCPPSSIYTLPGCPPGFSASSACLPLPFLGSFER